MHSNVTNVAKNPFIPYFVIYGQQTSLEKIWRRMHTSHKQKTLRTAHITSHITGASGVSQKHGCSFWSHTPEAPSLNSTTNQRTGLQKQVHIPIEDYQHSYRFWDGISCDFRPPLLFRPPFHAIRRASFAFADKNSLWA